MLKLNSKDFSKIFIDISIINNESKGFTYLHLIHLMYTNEESLLNIVDDEFLRNTKEKG